MALDEGGLHQGDGAFGEAIPIFGDDPFGEVEEGARGEKVTSPPARFLPEGGLFFHILGGMGVGSGLGDPSGGESPPGEERGEAGLERSALEFAFPDGEDPAIDERDGGAADFPFGSDFRQRNGDGKSGRRNLIAGRCLGGFTASGKRRRKRGLKPESTPLRREVMAASAWSAMTSRRRRSAEDAAVSPGESQPESWRRARREVTKGRTDGKRATRSTADSRSFFVEFE